MKSSATSEIGTNTSQSTTFQYVIYDLNQLCLLDDIDQVRPIKFLWEEFSQQTDRIIECWEDIVAAVFSIIQKSDKYIHFKEYRDKYSINWNGHSIRISDLIVESIPNYSKDPDEPFNYFIRIPSTHLYLNASYSNDILVESIRLALVICNLSPEDFWVKCCYTNINSTHKTETNKYKSFYSPADNSESENTIKNNIIKSDNNKYNNNEINEEVSINNNSYYNSTINKNKPDNQKGIICNTPTKRAEDNYTSKPLYTNIENSPHFIFDGNNDFSKLTNQKPLCAYYLGKQIVQTRYWSDIYYHFFAKMAEVQPSLFLNVKGLDSILLPISEFDYRTARLGLRRARQLNGTAYCIVTQKDAKTLLNDIQQCINQWNINSTDWIITYKPANESQTYSMKNAYQASSTEKQFQNSITETVRVRHKSQQFPQIEHEGMILETDDSIKSQTPNNIGTIKTELQYFDNITDEYNKNIQPTKILNMAQIDNSIDYSYLTPLALVIHVTDLQIIPVKTCQQLLTELFNYIYKDDPGILRRYARSALDDCIITEYTAEQAETDYLCGTHYKFKADITQNDMVTAIPEIIQQSCFSLEQFAIEHTSAKEDKLTTCSVRPEYNDATDFRARLQSICQIAIEKHDFQAFMIAYILINGPQTQRMLIDAYPKIFEESTYRAIIYNMERDKNWLVRSKNEYGNYMYDIPNAQACFEDSYVQKVFARIDADIKNIEISKHTPCSKVIVDELTCQSIERVLTEFFPHGYARGIRQQEKFREAWREVFRVNPDFCDIDAAIDAVTMQIDGIDYSYPCLLETNRLDALIKSIEQMFQDGAPFVEYDAIMERENDLLPLKTGAQLREYLKVKLPSVYRFKDHEFTPDDQYARSDIAEMLTDIVLSYGEPCTLDYIAKLTPFLSKATIAETLNDLDETILSDREVFMHIDNVGLDESEEKGIQNTLQNLLASRPLLSYSEFIAELADNPDTESAAGCLDRLQQVSLKMLKDLLNTRFGDEFRFAKAITQLDETSDEYGAITPQTASIANILANEFAGRERVTVEEIDEVVKKYGLTDGFQPNVYKYFYDRYTRISLNLFIQDADVDFDVTRIDNAIAEICIDEYIPLQELQCSILPPCGYTWNEYLLTSYLYRFSRRFTIRNKTVTIKGKTGLGGIIVKQSSILSTRSYNNILVIYTSNLTPLPESVEELGDILVARGLILKKTSALKSILNQAKELKENYNV